MSTTEESDSPQAVALTAKLGSAPERGLLARLQNLKVLLGTDSPEVRGWAPVVQQGAQATVNAAIAELKRRSALHTQALEELHQLGYTVRDERLYPPEDGATWNALADAALSRRDTRKLCTCDGTDRGPGRACVVKAGGRLGELWRCAKGHESPAPPASLNRYCRAGMCLATDDKHEPGCDAHSKPNVEGNARAAGTSR